MNPIKTKTEIATTLTNVALLIREREERIIYDIVTNLTAGNHKATGKHKVNLDTQCDLTFSELYTPARSEFSAVRFNVTFPARALLFTIDSVAEIRNDLEMSIGNYEIDVTIWANKNRINVNIYVHVLRPPKKKLSA